MQDPSFGVAPPLQHHVHLISGHRFPLLPSLSLEQAFRYLLDAPTIVSKTAAVAWHYVQAPQDGTIWLEWISPRYENRFASDGYVWGDPESTFRQDIGGYTIELMMHSVGYRPQHDHHATHARTRYHIIAKNPAINAATPDPSLWIVHYHHTDHSRVIPSQQVPVSPVMNQTVVERRALEARGRIDRRDFMLHDREHWPTITIPGVQMQQQGIYANPNMPPARFPQMQAYQQAQGPPAKRARYSSVNAVPGTIDGIHDTSIEDEENIALGDYFDHLTPREISLARYLQHHRWIEELFSSPYSSTQIVPPDLGLGLMGELKGLTEGILDTPSLEDFLSVSQRPPQAPEARPFTNLKREQVDEFNRRVEKHLEDGRAEIEKLKEEHAIRMAEWKKSTGIVQAEKRLRYATWEGHESAVRAFRVDVPEKNGHVEAGAPSETIENVVSDVEALLGKKIGTHKDAELVQKGGVQEEEPQFDEVMLDSSADLPPDDNNVTPIGAPEPEPGVRPSVQSEPQPQPQPTASEPTQEPKAAASTLGELGAETYTEDVTMMDGIDLDVDEGINIDGVDFGDIGPQQAADGVPATAEITPLPAVAASNATETATPIATNDQRVTVVEGQPTQAVRSTDLQQIPLPAGSDVAGTAAAAGIQDLSSAPVAAVTSEPATIDNNDTTATNDNTAIFDDDTFADLEDMGNADEGDGLLDFDGGVGLEDSAFGDAMHGMDTTGQDDGGQTGDAAP